MKKNNYSSSILNNLDGTKGNKPLIKNPKPKPPQKQLPSIRCCIPDIFYEDGEKKNPNEPNIVKLIGEKCKIYFLTEKRLVVSKNSSKDKYDDLLEKYKSLEKRLASLEKRLASQERKPKK